MRSSVIMHWTSCLLNDGAHLGVDLDGSSLTFLHPGKCVSTSGGYSFNNSPENQLSKFNAFETVNANPDQTAANVSVIQP